VAHAGGMQLDLDFVCDGIAHLDLVDAKPELSSQRSAALVLIRAILGNRSEHVTKQGINYDLSC
jgi:hypothetical protein